MLNKIRTQRKRLFIGLTVILIVGLGVYLATRFRTAPIDSIAILPFVNETHQTQTEYLSEGMAESLIDKLSQVPGLKTISRSSAFPYKGREIRASAIGEELKVQAILTGKIQFQKNQLLISAELIETGNNRSIWRGQYYRELNEIFAVQQEIAKAVLAQMHHRLSEAEEKLLVRRSTENPKAFQYYIQGRIYSELQTRESLLAAGSSYQKAAVEDGNYAPAYAGFAEVMINLGSRAEIPPDEGRRRAEIAIRKALDIDADFAPAHLASGEIAVSFAPYDFLRAKHELQRALELDPGLARIYQIRGNCYLLQSRYDEAKQEFLKSRELDPHSPVTGRSMALLAYLQGDSKQALELLRQTKESGLTFLNSWEAGIYIQNQAFDEALAAIEKEKPKRTDDVMLIASLGEIYAAQNRRDEALKIIKDLEARSGQDASQAQFIAAIYSLLKEREQSFAWLSKGRKAGSLLYFLRDDSIWGSIRQDPRFNDLLKQIDLIAS